MYLKPQECQEELAAEAPAALAEAREVTTGGGLLSRAFRQVWPQPGSLLTKAELPAHHSAFTMHPVKACR